MPGPPVVPVPAVTAVETFHPGYPLLRSGTDTAVSFSCKWAGELGRVHPLIPNAAMIIVFVICARAVVVALFSATMQITLGQPFGGGTGSCHAGYACNSTSLSPVAYLCPAGTRHSIPEYRVALLSGGGLMLVVRVLHLSTASPGTYSTAGLASCTPCSVSPGYYWYGCVSHEASAIIAQNSVTAACCGLDACLYSPAGSTSSGGTPCPGLQILLTVAC